MNCIANSIRATGISSCLSPSSWKWSAIKSRLILGFDVASSWVRTTPQELLRRSESHKDTSYTVDSALEHETASLLHQDSTLCVDDDNDTRRDGLDVNDIIRGEVSGQEGEPELYSEEQVPIRLNEQMEGDSVSPVVTDRDAPEPSAKHKSPRELHLQQDTDGENFFSDIEFEIDEEQFEETFNWPDCLKNSAEPAPDSTTGELDESRSTAVSTSADRELTPSKLLEGNEMELVASESEGYESVELRWQGRAASRDGDTSGSSNCSSSDGIRIEREMEGELLDMYQIGNDEPDMQQFHERPGLTVHNSISTSELEGTKPPSIDSTPSPPSSFPTPPPSSSSSNLVATMESTPTSEPEESITRPSLEQQSESANTSPRLFKEVGTSANRPRYLSERRYNYRRQIRGELSRHRPKELPIIRENRLRHWGATNLRLASERCLRSECYRSSRGIRSRRSTSTERKRYEQLIWPGRYKTLPSPTPKSDE